MTTAPSPAAGILAILKPLSLNTNGWQVTVGRFNATPDKQLVIKNTGGRAGEVCVAMDYPSVQLACRGTKGAGGYEEAYQKIKSAREALVAIPEATEYPELTSCVPISDIIDMGYDDSDRPWFVQNLQLIVSYESSGYRDALQP